MGAYQISVPGHTASEEAVRMRAYLEAQLKELERFGAGFDLEEVGQGDRTVFRCLNRKLGRQREKGLRHGLGNAVAEYLITIDEPALIRKIIRMDFRYRDPEESKQIETYAFHLLSETEEEEEETPYLHRKERMARQVANYFTHSRTLAVDGFFRFRMKRYKKVLVKLVEHAIDEYLLDQEYQEFIDLLRYFVSAQQSKIPLVHVFHGGRRQFRLLTEEGNPLSLKEMDGVVQELMTESLSQEDLIVSTLLTAAPERVVLHSLHPGENVIRTLVQIFEGRITVCKGCSDCHVHFRSREDG
ncbi:sporulation protein YtxC [Salinithrix halophila]